MAAKGNFERMNREEKVQFINNELSLLHDCCINNSISSFRTKAAASSFLSLPKETRKRQNTLQILIKLSFVVGLLAVVFSYQPVNRFLAASTQLAKISVLPVFDWSVMHESVCLVENPFNIESERLLEPEDCWMCLNISNVSSLDSSNAEEIGDNFLKKDLPVVIVENNQPVNSNTDMSINKLFELYMEDEILRLYSCCEFESNLNIPKKNHRALLIGIRDGYYSEYYAHWQNCFKDAAKLFRRAYIRPAFLPTAVELVDTNWVLVSSHYKGSNSIQMPLEHNVIILIQLSGYIEVVLHPRPTCDEQCSSLSFTLHKGSTMIITDLLYDIEYRPCSTDNAVTVGLGGNLDP